MKCYTIDETVTPGLQLSAGIPVGDPILRVGEPGTCMSIPVSREIRAAFEERYKYISRLEKLVSRLEVPELADAANRELIEEMQRAQKDSPHLKDQVEYAMHGNNKLRGLSPHEAFANIWIAAGKEKLRLNYADVSDNDPIRLIKDRGHSSECLVHVITKAPLDGKMWLAVNRRPDVEVDTPRGREVRQLDLPFPPPGVRVIAQGYGPGGEHEVLLRMTLKASFRICRSGDPSTFGERLDGEPARYPELLVVWPGSTLRCFPPKKYAKKAA